MQNHDNKSFKWSIGGTYNPCKTMTTNHLNVLSKCIDDHLAHFDNIVIMGDFNSESTQLEIQEFCELYTLKNLVKEPTCYKNPDIPILHRFNSNQSKKHIL